MKLDAPQLADLTQKCIAIAERAGVAIMEIYNTAFDVSHKDDASPVTEADIAAHRIIVQGLSSLDPELPILSEESHPPDFTVRSAWSEYWLVDPLDGTREFVKRNGEFTVNIALIEGHESILGVVHAPVSAKTWYASRGNGSWKKTVGGRAQPIHARSPGKDGPLTILKSRSHPGKRLQTFLDRIGPHETLALGSSLKTCMIAEGKADFYARLGPTSEWDTAAAHCVLAEAGGDVTDTAMKRLNYNTKASLLNPEFFAFGCEAPDWSEFL